VKILCCLDSWKGSLSALEACQQVAAGLKQSLPDVNCVLYPMADGGEGTLNEVHQARPGEQIFLEVCGPFAERRMRAPYLMWPDAGEALIEMAVCAGLPLLKPEERDPLRATTRGVGELMQDALRRGAKHLTLAVGGSATVDGGTGAARAFGWRFLDHQGRDLPEGGGALLNLARVIPPAEQVSFELEVMCDVTNPLLGAKGAAAVFAPQKGADEAGVALLEDALGKLSDCLRRDVGKDLADLPGAGASGGLAAGALAFFDGRLRSGIEVMLDLSGLREAIPSADWVVTGEGRLDTQSLDGKVVSGVVDAAKKPQVPVVVVTGKSLLSEDQIREAGIQHVESANHMDLPLEEAFARASELAESAGNRLGLWIASCGNL